jgi:hypothetical protein
MFIAQSAKKGDPAGKAAMMEHKVSRWDITMVAPIAPRPVIVPRFPKITFLLHAV